MWVIKGVRYTRSGVLGVGPWIGALERDVYLRGGGVRLDGSEVSASGRVAVGGSVSWGQSVESAGCEASRLGPLT